MIPRRGMRPILTVFDEIAHWNEAPMIPINYDDPFLTYADRLVGERLSAWAEPARLYGCETCGCIFVPSGTLEAGGELYPDRFEMGGGCDRDCPCHAMPELITIPQEPTEVP